MALPAPNFRLRPGWHPDPGGEDLYRYYDGYEWTEIIQPVPEVRRLRFDAHRAALVRLAAAADEVYLHAVPTRHVSGGVGRGRDADPGRSAANLGLVAGVIGMWPAALWFARISRLRSAAVGRPRSGMASAALGAGIFAAIWTTGLLVLMVVT